MKTMREAVPVGWERTDAVIRCGDEDWIARKGESDPIGAYDDSVRGYASPRVPGLVLTPTAAKQRDLGVWRVTHANSGLAIGSAIETLAEAAMIAERFAPFVDWTVSRDALLDRWTDKAFTAALRAAASEGFFDESRAPRREGEQ